MALLIGLTLCLVVNFAALGIVEGLDGVYDHDDRIVLMVLSFLIAPVMSVIFACLGIARFVRSVTKEFK